MVTDPISDMVVRLKNADRARRQVVSFPYSQLKEKICEILQKEGFVKSFSKKGKKIAKTIEVELNSESKKIKGVKRISKPSRRIYFKSSGLRPVKSGYGVLVISTPKGIMTGKEARKVRTGGEALFEIW
ncbi:MAG TPA: 30S ribosomal protein S8 [Candidatus Paceibacterota bacterium]